MAAKVYRRATPEWIEEHAAELAAERWRVVGSSRYADGQLSLLLAREFTDDETPTEEGSNDVPA